MEKKILAIVVSIAMVGVMFSGCGCKKNKKSQEVNKEEKKVETAVEGSTGFESASDEKNKTNEVAKNDNKKAKDDFDLDMDDEKKDKKTEKNVRSKSAPKKSVKGQNKNNVKNVVPAKNGKPDLYISKDLNKPGDKKMSEEDLKKMAAFFKGVEEGKKDVNKEATNQGAAKPAGGEQKKAPEKVEKPEVNKEAAPDVNKKPVEPKKN